MRIVRFKTDDGETRYSVVETAPSTSVEVTLCELRIFGRNEGINEAIYTVDWPRSGRRRAVGPLTRSESALTLRWWRKQCAASPGEPDCDEGDLCGGHGGRGWG